MPRYPRSPRIVSTMRPVRRRRHPEEHLVRAVITGALLAAAGFLAYLALLRL